MGHCTKQEKNYNYFHIYANEILYPFIMSKTSLFMITVSHTDTKLIWIKIETSKLNDFYGKRVLVF